MESVTSPTGNVLRALILQAAADTLLHEHPSGFETREVANRAGTTQSEIHYFFGSRDGLLIAAAEKINRDHVEQTLEKMDSLEDPRQKIDAYVEEVITFHTKHLGAGVVAAYPQLFAHSAEAWRQEATAVEKLNISERQGTVTASCLYAIRMDKPYRLLNRGRMALVYVRYPEVIHSGLLIGMSLAGFARVWAQHQQRPIFGFDPEKALRRAVRQEVEALAKTPLAVPAVDDDIFE